MKRALLVGTLALAGCRPAMTTTIENRGDPIDLSYLCGDAKYETKLASGASVEWKPVANSCSLYLEGPPKGRNLLLQNRCASSNGCSVGVNLPMGTGGPPPPGLSGNGRIEVVGNVVTATPTP